MTQLCCALICLNSIFLNKSSKPVTKLIYIIITFVLAIFMAINEAFSLPMTVLLLITTADVILNSLVNRSIRDYKFMQKHYFLVFLMTSLYIFCEAFLSENTSPLIPYIPFIGFWIGNIFLLPAVAGEIMYRYEVSKERNKGVKK